MGKVLGPNIDLRVKVSGAWWSTTIYKLHELNGKKEPKNKIERTKPSSHGECL